MSVSGMAISDKQLRKKEYLPVFDTFCDKLQKRLKLPEKKVVSNSNGITDLAEIREIRVQQMLSAYIKYGPVKANYITYQLMLPLQEATMRVVQYEKTKNIEYLLDAMNFLMLEYWRYTTEEIQIESSLLETYRCVAIQITECYTKLSKCVLACLREYTETDDLVWIGIIALLIQQEIQRPQQSDAFYAYTAGACVEVAGTYIRELEAWTDGYK